MPLPAATWRLPAAALALGLVVLPLGDQAGWVWLLGLVLLLLAAAADLASAVAPDRIHVRRDVPTVVTLLDEAPLRWEIRNTAGRAAHVALADAVPPSLGARRRRVAARVPPGAAVTARTSLRPQRRGDLSWEVVTVRVHGPLGLVARQADRVVPATIRVHPRFVSRKEAELRIERARLLEVGLRSARARGTGTEFDSLREYTVDDEQRRIDWAATARARKPIVRTYRAERNQHVLILLDHGRTMAGRVQGVPRLEHAMDAAMTLAAVAGRLGDRVGLVGFADTVDAVLPPRPGKAQLTRLTESLYRLDARLVESDHRAAFLHAAGRFRRRALLVLLTDLAEAPVAESLLPALPLIVRTHLVIVAGIADPRLAGWADASPAVVEGAYRKAAAAEAQEERRATMAALRGRGATVLDLPPDRLPGRLADAYLEVKASGRL